MKKIKELGTITLSGKVVVSDPCYDRDVWCMITDLAVKPGQYRAWVILSDEKNWGERVAALIVVHEDSLHEKIRLWQPVEGTLGVDSGQCGIFDDSVYPCDGDHPDGQSLYRECCKTTLADEQAGPVQDSQGVVSSSGYGDGSYLLSAFMHKGERVALMIDYDLANMKTIIQKLAERCAQK